MGLGGSNERTLKSHGLQQSSAEAMVACLSLLLLPAHCLWHTPA